MWNMVKLINQNYFNLKKINSIICLINFYIKISYINKTKYIYICKVDIVQ